MSYLYIDTMYNDCAFLASLEIGKTFPRTPQVLSSFRNNSNKIKNIFKNYVFTIKNEAKRTLIVEVKIARYKLI